MIKSFEGFAVPLQHREHTVIYFIFSASLDVAAGFLR